jgi:hypothetical protein
MSRSRSEKAGKKVHEESEGSRATLAFVKFLLLVKRLSPKGLL